MQLIQIPRLLGYKPQLVDLDALRLHTYLLGKYVNIAMIGKALSYLNSIALSPAGCNKSADQHGNFHNCTILGNLTHKSQISNSAVSRPAIFP